MKIPASLCLALAWASPLMADADPAAARWLAGAEIRAGRLVALLPGWEALIAPGPERAIWGVYPPKRNVAPKVRVFLGFLETRFGRPPYWDRPA